MRLYPNAIVDGRSAISVAAARVDSWGTPRRGPEWVRGAGEKIPAPLVPARDKSGPIPGRLTPTGGFYGLPYEMRTAFINCLVGPHVILRSAATKDLLCPNKKQIPRFARDDTNNYGE
jgi:hypothetical protein